LPPSLLQEAGPSADSFGADEVVFEIGMDRSGGLNCPRVHGDGLGAAFVFAGGEERE